MFLEYSTPSFEEKYTYTGKDLGHRWEKDQTAFRLWAPTATSASVCLYRSGTWGTDDLVTTIPMAQGQSGTWTACAQGDWNGFYYTYRACVNGNTVETIDPYAVSAGVNGQRGMILNLRDTDPEGWSRDASPVKSSRYTDDVIYELHVRDLSADASSGIAAKGKFLGLTEEGTTTKSGLPTGLDHICKLGITHVHLLPFYDYGSVDEAHPEKGYNWGYDPVNYNLPEGSYSTDPWDGFSRVRELKQMILTLHKRGLGVVMDVVYNHVYHVYEFSINQLVPGYFSRQDAGGKLSCGSGCGNDTASERAMVRKFIVDSVNFWADEYHLDGFRFDIASLLDVQTIQEVISTVRQKHPHVIFYGEGWDMSTVLTKPGICLAAQKNAYQLPEFGFFNDTIRDTLRGSIFDRTAPGYAAGAPVSREQLLDCFRGVAGWNQCPSQVINYVSCHDDFALYDRLALALPEAREEELARRSRLAAAFTLLSIGVPFFQAGEEMLRSKKKRSGEFDGNSYRSPDSVNAIKWSRLKNREVAATLRYYQGLLAIRRQHPLFRLSDPAQVMQSVSLLPQTAPSITAFQLTNAEETIVVAFNPDKNPAPFQLPQGLWTVAAKDSRADANGLEQAQGAVSLPPISAYVAILNKA